MSLVAESPLPTPSNVSFSQETFAFSVIWKSPPPFASPFQPFSCSNTTSPEENNLPSLTSANEICAVPTAFADSPNAVNPTSTVSPLPSLNNTTLLIAVVGKRYSHDSAVMCSVGILIFCSAVVRTSAATDPVTFVSLTVQAPPSNPSVATVAPETGFSSTNVYSLELSASSDRS